MTATEDVDSGHSDRVTVLHINFDGSKILTASIDHRVKVWNVDPATGERKLLETFTAHDADIRDAKWLHPSTGTHLATIGNDLKCHLWQEDPHQAPNSGRRFRRIHTIPSKPRVPFVSLDFKNIDNLYTILALIDRQGLLSVYEPTSPDEFKDWTLIDQFNVCMPPPGRGEQTCFKVRFDQNVTPLPYINCVSDDRKQLGLVVTAMNEVKIYQSINSANAEQNHTEAGGMPSNLDDVSHRFMFYEVAKLPVHPALIRDVQWAPFNVRGTDIFATACKDGAIRIFELSVSESGESKDNSNYGAKNANNSSQSIPPRTPANAIRQQPLQSSLTTAITGRNNQTQPTDTSSAGTPSTNLQQDSPSANPATPTRSQARTTHTFPYTTHITLQANLEHAHDDAWSVVWDPSGQVLLSGGSDGSTKIWRQGILDALQQRQSQGQNRSQNDDASRLDSGRWKLFADQAVELGDVVDDSDEESGNE